MEELGPGVELLTESVAEGVAAVTYLVQRFWRVSVTAQVAVPWDGPERVEVAFTADADSASDAVEAADATNGITTGVLRAIPLADARVRLRRLKARAQLAEEVADLPTKLQTEWQWAEFARLYVLAAGLGDQPLAALEAVTGISRRTLDSRARQARQKGLVSKPTKASLGELTPKAQELLAKGRAQ